MPFPRLLFTLTLASGCATHTWQARGVAPAERPVRVAVADPVLLQSFEGGDAFALGTVVGDLVFSGGVTRDPELGAVSENVDQKNHHALMAIANSTVSNALAMALTRRGVTVVDGETAATPMPERVLDYSHGRGDGRDNQALPRFWLGVDDADTDMVQAWPAGVDAVVLPVVVHHYSHNAGWFPGQTWGSNAGARYRVFIATWGVDGRVLATTELDVRRLSTSTGQPEPSERARLAEETRVELARRLDRVLWKKVSHGGGTGG